jgi:urease accessory protein
MESLVMKMCNSFSKRLAYALTALTLSVPAAAHHPMGGATPGTLMEGLLSGFGHPIIGFDHLLFIVAVGIACYFFGRRIATLTVLLLGALGGTLLHLRLPNVPYADAWVAASLIVLGLLLLRRSGFLEGKIAVVLFALSGIAHGYAYGEAIVGAEATPLLAYLTGFTLVQFAIAMVGYAIARFVTAKKPAFAFLKTTGGTLAATGAAFLVLTFAG